MPRIPQNLRECANGMLNAGMAMNAVTTDNAYSTRTVRHLRQRFQATERTEDRPRSGRPRVTPAVFGTPTCAVASKMPQLLLLTLMVHITTVYLPKLCAIACTRVGQVQFVHVLVMFWRDVTA